jgi:hypothetical protein
MAKEEYIPLSVRIKTATQKLKDAGYVVFNDDDTKFAILAERQRYICKNINDFFKTTIKLTENSIQ